MTQIILKLKNLKISNLLIFNLHENIKSVWDIRLKDEKPLKINLNLNNIFTISPDPK